MLARIGLLLSAAVVAAALAGPAAAREGCGFRWHMDEFGVCVPNALNLGAKAALNDITAPPPPVRVVINERPMIADRPIITVVRPAPLPNATYDPGSMTIVPNE